MFRGTRPRAERQWGSPTARSEMGSALIAFKDSHVELGFPAGSAPQKKRGIRVAMSRVTEI
jgi:hypothetical protein